MDPSSIFRSGQFVTTVAGAVYAQRGILSPTSLPVPRVTFDDVQAAYGRHFDRAMRMPVCTFHELVHQLRPRLPRRGTLLEVRAAIALRYLGGGSYIDICAALGVRSATVYRALWDVVDAEHANPLLHLDFQLEDRTRRLSYAAGFQSLRDSPCGTRRLERPRAFSGLGGPCTRKSKGCTRRYNVMTYAIYLCML